MEIKTTEQILNENTILTKPDLLLKADDKKWVAVDDMIKLVDYARNHCRGEPDELEKILLDALSKKTKSSAEESHNKNLTDFNWELEQIEKALLKFHTPAENIMNIVRDVQSRALDKHKVEEVIDDLKYLVGGTSTTEVVNAGILKEKLGLE